MSFGVTKIERDGRLWVMEFFDARSEWAFEEFAEALRGLGVALPSELPDPPPSGSVFTATWRGSNIDVGYSDERGCHLRSADEDALKELSRLTQALPEPE